MKNTLLLFSLAIALFKTSFGQQDVVASANEPLKKGFSVHEICSSKWDAQNGLAYKKAAGANLGVTSFELMDKNRLAFLSDASNEIVVIDKLNGKTLSKFNVASAPRDFVCDKETFYVLYENRLMLYNEKGKEIKTFFFGNSFPGVVRMARYNNATYLLLPSGNSVQIETGGNETKPQAFKGWITSSGNFVITQLNGGNSYSVLINTTDGKSSEKKFSTSKKAAGVYVVGSTKTRLVLDVQTYVSESPISVERHIVSIELGATGLGNIVSDIKVPDCYYVLSNKDFAVLDNGTVMNMLTSPSGIFLFSLHETELAKTKNYPASLLATRYHFNDHLQESHEQK